MKKIMIFLFLGTTLLSFAQTENRQKKMNADFTSEQKAILKTKQMALELDLTDGQQKQMLALNKKWAEEKATRKAKMKSVNEEEMTSDERFNHMNAMLDSKIAHQSEVKKILTEDQYAEWKKATKKMPHRSKDRRPQHYRQNRVGQK
ncbi:DUF4890 domain-containing protein [Lutimonas vermicola]|uniref:DUF4890 domain-containing protein n=1 Tax=Lutimonas vermicola TaxID=414288 RepID=A0ABU9L0H3_9FLAO